MTSCLVRTQYLVHAHLLHFTLLAQGVSLPAGTIPGAHPVTPTHVLTHLLRGLPALFLVVGSWREGGCVEPVQALEGKLQSS